MIAGVGFRVLLGERGNGNERDEEVKVNAEGGGRYMFKRCIGQFEQRVIAGVGLRVLLGERGNGNERDEEVKVNAEGGGRRHVSSK